MDGLLGTKLSLELAAEAAGSNFDGAETQFPSQ
jgi:hypothetical protein